MISGALERASTHHKALPLQLPLSRIDCEVVPTLKIALLIRIRCHQGALFDQLINQLSQILAGPHLPVNQLIFTGFSKVVDRQFQQDAADSFRTNVSPFPKFAILERNLNGMPNELMPLGLPFFEFGIVV